MKIRQLITSEYCEAIALSLDVFVECDTADFDLNGLETFKSFIYNKELINAFSIFGAFDNETLIGTIGTKNSGAHISLFFIAPNFQRRSIGRELFNYAYANQEVKEITVNASSSAVGFYKSLGFLKMDNEQETNGLRYTPMKKVI